VSPLAFGAVVILRHFGYVARLSLWAYLIVLVLSPGISLFVESWRGTNPRSPKLHFRLAAHMTAVTVVIYMTGWGPVLLITYAFVVLEDMEQCGAAVWKVAMPWSFAGIAVGQLLVWVGWAPSFLARDKAQGVGLLGVIALAMVIRMAGATGMKK
jgi:hypothetical protein